MEIDRLYATMFHEWDALQKDVTDIEEAVRSLTWSVNPFTRDGEEPEPLAAEVAKTVQDALWRRSTPVPGSVGHTFQQMLGAVVHAVYRGFNVHQIEWKNDGELVYPARFIQLPPQFLMWENRAGRPDRLLLVPDGMNYKGVPFPAHKFIVAINTSGPDHPIYNATFYSLVNWFLAFKKGIGWFMEYTQKYGMPKQILHYQSDRDRAQLMADLRDDSVLNTVLLKEGRDIDIQYPSAGSASLPQAVLLQKAEEACHKAILGQTLTSDTSSNGGSLAQAKVHAGVQADVVLKRAEFVADVLNQQLIPAIVMANYGRIDGIPLPELRCKLPQAEANIERAQFLKTALEVPGVEIVKSEAYEYLGLAMPTEGDEVLKAPEQPQQQPGGMPGGFPRGGEVLGKEKQPANEPAEETVMSARKTAPVDPTEEWLAPLKKKLAEAREAGASLAEIKDQLRAWRPNTRALAAAMAQNIKEGFLGANTENVAADNPYGCNQHGHGWVDSCPYGGDGAGPASKGAIAIAGGAENVTPQDDDDEEEKKKKEKAAAEAKAKEEAKQVVAVADEREKKWDELSAFYKKKLEEMSGLKGTKEYEKAQAAVKTIDWYKGSFAHWKEKLANGTEEERAAAVDALRRISQTERDAAQMQAYEKKAKTAFNKLAKVMKDFSAKKEGPVKRRTPSANIEDDIYKMPAEKKSAEVCAAAAEGKGGLQNLWNNEFSLSQKKIISNYSNGYYEEYNSAFRQGKENEDTKLIRSVFEKASLPKAFTVTRGEGFGAAVEISSEFSRLGWEYEYNKVSREEAISLLYNHLRERLDKGEEIIRNSAAPTSTSAQGNAGFSEKGIVRLIHIPKGAKALSIAPVSRHEWGGIEPTEKLDIEKYKSESKDGEREILIHPGAKFRTIGVQIGEGGTLYIEDELIE